MTQERENRDPLSEGGRLSGQKETYLLDTDKDTHTFSHSKYQEFGFRAGGYVLMSLNHCPIPHKITDGEVNYPVGKICVSSGLSVLKCFFIHCQTSSGTNFLGRH